MILGHGDIASILIDQEDRLFFACGVSNSQEMRESEYKREIDLLLSQDRSQHIVYFGSLSIFYGDNRYTKHKKLMESLVKSFPRHTIVRLGNIDWGSNPHTLINFFREKVKRGEELEIKEGYRYIVGKEEFLYWIDLIPDWNCEMNVVGERLTIKQIAERYVYS